MPVYPTVKYNIKCVNEDFFYIFCPSGISLPTYEPQKLLLTVPDHPLVKFYKKKYLSC